MIWLKASEQLIDRCCSKIILSNGDIKITVTQNRQKQEMFVDFCLIKEWNTRQKFIHTVSNENNIFVDVHYVRWASMNFIPQLTLRPWLYNEFNLLKSPVAVSLAASPSLDAYIYCQAKMTPERIGLLKSHLVKKYFLLSAPMMKNLPGCLAVL